MKICPKCKEEKELSCFNKNKKRYDGLQGYCRDCCKDKSKIYYSENKDKMINQIYEKKNIRIKKNKSLLLDLLKNSICIDCSNNNYLVLEFDHREYKDKFMEVGRMVHDGYSWKKIKNEIEKCEIRCANCHRIKTSIEQNWYKNIV